MCPPASVLPPANIGDIWTDGELLRYLEKHTRDGSPFPGDVLTYVNPYQCIPKYLPGSTYLCIVKPFISVERVQSFVCLHCNKCFSKRPAQLFVTVNCHLHRNYDVGASLSNWSKNSYGYAVYAERMWYYIDSEEKKDTEHGFWKAKGEACKISSNSDVAGCRTTLEFYEGQAPRGRKTDWVMQEYRLTKPKESGSLCRVFSAGQSSNLAHHEQGGTDTDGESHLHSVPAAVPYAGNTSGEGSVSKSQVMNRENERGPLNVAEKVQNFLVENLHENDYVSRGDYLALVDLDSELHSSSSDNSSRLSLSSDAFFDSEALLRDLEDGINQDLQGEDANLNFSVSASVKPNEVVMCPATLGSLISSNGSKSPPERTLRLDYSLPSSAIQGKIPDKGVPKHATKSQKADHKSEGSLISSNGSKSPPERTLRLDYSLPGSAIQRKIPDKGVPKHATKSQKADHKSECASNSYNAASSSRSQKAVSEGKKKAVVARVKKPKRKYLCFLPF